MKSAHTQEATQTLSEQQRPRRMATDSDSITTNPNGTGDDSDDMSFTEEELEEFAKSPMFAMISEAVERASDELKREIGLRPDGTPINYKVRDKHKGKKRKINDAAPSSKVVTAEASRSSGDHRTEVARLKSRERVDKPDGKQNFGMGGKREDKLDEEIARRRNELIAKLRELNTEIDKEYCRLRRLDYFRFCRVSDDSLEKEKAKKLAGEIIREEGLRL
ncbi:uncharacterized protein FOMMEDRAFT_30958 [Fomitiporia mediterranea MF3/22]|uniref:uncharacterized protein n=1 Tax=Fomitiporia mediterranea (strain MF3/22) TaxID=694068 RepID=UPI0004409C7B|nr:uncharacterized protein FOMMEDRAFT_30958 [Fomitiporia mediterranea MF3/22]EJC99643.1 hypothetical protein FOMMEDRAFT_30958 [Fomitiporia mediterranea MF3/22]